MAGFGRRTDVMLDVAVSSAGTQRGEYGLNGAERVEGILLVNDVTTAGAGTADPETLISQLTLDRSGKTILQLSGLEITELHKALLNDSPQDSGDVDEPEYKAVLPVILNPSDTKVSMEIVFATDADVNGGRFQLVAVLKPGRSPIERFCVRQVNVSAASIAVPERGKLIRIILQNDALADGDTVTLIHDKLNVIDRVDVRALYAEEEANNVAEVATRLILYCDVDVNKSTTFQLSTAGNTTLVWVFEAPEV